MTINELRDAHLSQPFKPFTLELADGQKVPVPHPEFMTSAPKSRSIAVFTPRGTHKIIDLLMVVAIDSEMGNLADDVATVVFAAKSECFLSPQPM